MQRYLTTQERVDLAVKAGHYAFVKDYIQMHNNGDGTELKTLRVLDPLGAERRYTLIPPYAIAAVDCYLTSYGIPLTVEDGKVEEATISTSSHNLAKYALKAADDAIRYRKVTDRPSPLVERVAYALEYEATDTAFSVLEKIIELNPVQMHGMTLEKDEEHQTETIVFDDGTRIERSYDCEDESPHNRMYSLIQLEDQVRPDSDKLIDTLMTQLDDLLMIGDLDFGGPDATTK